MEIIFLLVYLILSFIVLSVAKSKGRNGCGWFFLSLILSPVIVIIILLVIGDTDEKRREKLEEQAQIFSQYQNRNNQREVEEIVNKVDNQPINKLQDEIFVNKKAILAILLFIVCIIVLSLFLSDSGKRINNSMNENKEQVIPANERTFDNCYKVKDKILYKITIRKNLDGFSVIFNTDDEGNKLSAYLYSGKDLKLRAQSVIDNGDYWYWGRCLDNSGNIGSIKIQTYRPLEDFIVNGVSSDEKENIIWQNDAYGVQMFGATKFVVGEKTQKNINENSFQSNNTTSVISEERGLSNENTEKTYLERLTEAKAFWCVLPWNEVNNRLNACKYRDIIAERYHIWFDLDDVDSDSYYLTNPKDIIGKYYIAGRSMDNFRVLRKSDFDRWANSNGVPITALDPRTTISPQWYKRHSYEECIGILKYGVESEDADEIGQTLKRRIEDNVYYQDEIVEAVKRFQNRGYLSKVTNREIKEFFEKELRQY